jgi:isopenicillin-N epimerase
MMPLELEELEAMPLEELEAMPLEELEAMPLEELEAMPLEELVLVVPELEELDPAPPAPLVNSEPPQPQTRPSETIKREAKAGFIEASLARRDYPIAGLGAKRWRKPGACARPRASTFERSNRCDCDTVARMPEDALALGAHWTLDPATTFLNHGSFGACPRVVLAAQQRVRDELERQPVRFFRELEGRMDEARAEVARFVGAEPSGLAFVTNATTGVNAVLASIQLGRGDELLTTDHAYNACRNALDRAAERAGAHLVIADLPYPVTRPEGVVEALLERFTKRTRLALVDHVTSPTGLVLPIEEIVRELQARGVDVLVDGAHAPGMVPLSLDALGAAYYTGNLHKWVCAPKGVGFLHVRSDRRGATRPTVISHGANATRRDRSRFALEFDWTGTADPSAFLAVPVAIRFMGSLLPGGFPAVMEANRKKALLARARLAASLGVELPAPDSMVGSLAAVPLPDGHVPAGPPLYLDPLQSALFERFAIEVPIVPFPRWPKRLVRISAQLYNPPSDYDKLADAVRVLLAEGY